MQASENQRPYVIEALAVVWAVKHFRDIIYYYSITIYTDQSAVTQLFSGKNLTGPLARWYLTVMQFEPTIRYLSSKANTVADNFCKTFQLLP